MHALVALILVLLQGPALPPPSNDCPTPVNGAPKGGPGNIQDHMFHSLAIDLNDANVVYAGTETSGIFKSSDGGATWTRLRGGLKCTAQKTGYSQIFDIAIDPADSRRLYAATVNGPGPPGDPETPSASGGVYKSVDGGMSWVQKNQGFTNTYATYVLVDGIDPNRLYTGIGGLASTFQGERRFYEGGIWSSDDGAESWRALPLPAGVSSNIFIDMALRGINQRTLYASAQIHGSDAAAAAGLIRSLDGGQTWSLVNPPGVTVYGFDAFRQDPRILYGHDDSNGRRVHSSLDGGDTWTGLPASFFGVVRVHPRESRTLIYTGRTSLHKSTDGFTNSRQTYNDGELNENQQMTDIEYAQSNPDVVWACAKGYYLYKSVDGGETFTKITAVRDMIYGSATSGTLPAAFDDAARQTGIALVNSAASPASVTLSARLNGGEASQARPLTITIPAHGQWSRLVSEIFPGFAGAAGGWIQAASRTPGVTGFYMNFDPEVTTLDGGGFLNRPYTDWILPEAASAEIDLVNPGTSAAVATLILVDEAGRERARSALLRLVPNGRLAPRAADLFAPELLAPGTYLRVEADREIVVSERFGAPGRDSGTIGGLHLDGGARLLYSPQYVDGGGYRSVVTLINLENTPTRVTVGWRDNRGDTLGNNATVELPGRGRGTISGAGAFAVAAPAAGLDGYLAVSSNPALITGVVRFSDAPDKRFQAALPLLAYGSTEALYPHVANDSRFFTGVAAVNSNANPANVTITVFDAEGVRIGGGIRVIPPRGRFSELLSQIDPSLPPMTRGYFKIVSDRAVLSYGVFGTRALSALAAIPSQSPSSAPPGSGWTDLGRILEPTDFGRPAGSIIGDPTGVLLPDGRIRLFVFVDGHGVWRALSDDPQGTSFRVEGPCTLIPDAGTNTRGTPWGMPRVTPIPGGLRMYYMQDGGIASATSADHITWRQEPGLRITPAQAGLRETTTGSLIRLPGGGYRIYFSELRRSPSDPATAMKSASSPDMLAWTMDPGVRIGPGALYLDQNATDPFVLANPDGTTMAWYFVQPASGSSFKGPSGLHTSTSTDGLAFQTSILTGIPGGNPNVIVRADGKRLMYLSANDTVRGPGIRAVRLD